MKTLTSLLAFPTVLLAHPGHPGPADHGEITHALLGLGVALIVLTGIWMILKTNNRRKAPARVRKDPHNG